MKDEFTSNAKFFVGYGVAAAISLLFATSVALGYAMSAIGLLAAAFLIGSGRLIVTASSEYSPLGRVIAHVVKVACYWAACMPGWHALKPVLEGFGVPDLTVSSIGIVPMIVLPLWLLESLCTGGWNRRVMSLACMIVSFAKESAYFGIVHFEELDSQPIELSRSQQVAAKRRILYGICLLGFFVYVINSVAYALAASPQTVADLVGIVGMIGATIVINLWFMSLVYRLIDIAWNKKGVSHISPWEEFLIYS